MTNDTVTQHYKRGVLHRINPLKDPAPLVFDIPRSGRDYPNDFKSPASFNEVKTSISMYVEELFDEAPANGATWLYACFPNAYIDANRHEHDIDPTLIDGTLDTPFEPTEKSKLGVGLIHSVTDANKALLQQTPIATADLQRRLDAFYWPYHNELAAILKNMQADAGIAHHVSCHSMSSIARAVSKDAGEQRSDFDIGDRHGETCNREFVDTVQAFLGGFGYDVTINKHFAGAESIRKHGEPANGIQSLQIETRRGLYMDEESYQKRPEFETVRGHLGQLAAHLSNYARQKAQNLG